MFISDFTKLTPIRVTGKWEFSGPVTFLFINIKDGSILVCTKKLCILIVDIIKHFDAKTHNFEVQHKKGLTFGSPLFWCLTLLPAFESFPISTITLLLDWEQIANFETVIIWEHIKKILPVTAITKKKLRYVYKYNT